MTDPTHAGSMSPILQTSAAAGHHLAPNALVKPDAVQHASCGVMGITYCERVPEHYRARTHGDIHILIPGDGGFLDVTRESADGRPAMTLLRGHRILVVPAGRLHALHCQHQSELVMITLDQAYFERQAVEALACLRPQLVEPHAAVDPLLKVMGNCLRSQFQMGRIPSAIYLEFLAGVIAIHLAKNYVGNEPAMSDDAAPDHVWLPAHKLNRVEAFIGKHFKEPIKVEQVAAEIDMSPFHFSRMFKRATGCSPYLYITIKRVECASELLRNTEIGLAEVASRVGFQTQSHFTHVFRRFSGLTPQLFRNSCQNASA